MNIVLGKAIADLRRQGVLDNAAGSAMDEMSDVASKWCCFASPSLSWVVSAKRDWLFCVRGARGPVELFKAAIYYDDLSTGAWQLVVCKQQECSLHPIMSKNYVVCIRNSPRDLWVALTIWKYGMKASRRVAHEKQAEKIDYRISKLTITKA